MVHRVPAGVGQEVDRPRRPARAAAELRACRAVCGRGLQHRQPRTAGRAGVQVVEHEAERPPGRKADRADGFSDPEQHHRRRAGIRPLYGQRHHWRGGDRCRPSVRWIRVRPTLVRHRLPPHRGRTTPSEDIPMTRLPSLILSAILLAGLAIAGESDPCAVKLHVTLHSYDGPVEIADACVTATTYTGDL